MPMLRSPKPRNAPLPYTEVVYARKADILLPKPSWPQAGFFRVLGGRRSRLPVGPPSISQLATVLWFSGKEYERYGKPGAPDYWEHRAVPSAGGCHPIDIIVRTADR